MSTEFWRGRKIPSNFFSETDAADLGSGSATDNFVLTADGSGGSAWEAVPDAYAGAAAEIHAASGKTTPVAADELALVDSAASNVLKKLTWANLMATLQADPVWVQARLLSATTFGAL